MVLCGAVAEVAVVVGAAAAGGGDDDEDAAASAAAAIVVSRWRIMSCAMPMALTRADRSWESFSSSTDNRSTSRCFSSTAISCRRMVSVDGSAHNRAAMDPAGGACAPSEAALPGGPPLVPGGALADESLAGTTVWKEVATLSILVIEKRT